MAFFDKNRNILQQAVDRGKRPDVGTTGPFAPAFRNPQSVTDPWVSKLSEQPDAKKLYRDSFWPAKDAEQAQMLYDSSDVTTQFTTQEDDTLAQDFLSKYADGVRKGLINSPVREDLYMETPAEGLGSQVNIAGRIKPPGVNGTSTT